MANSISDEFWAQNPAKYGARFRWNCSKFLYWPRLCQCRPKLCQCRHHRKNEIDNEEISLGLTPLYRKRHYKACMVKSYNQYSLDIRALDLFKALAMRQRKFSSSDITDEEKSKANVIAAQEKLDILFFVFRYLPTLGWVHLGRVAHTQG